MGNRLGGLGADCRNSRIGRTFAESPGRRPYVANSQSHADPKGLRPYNALHTARYMLLTYNNTSGLWDNYGILDIGVCLGVMNSFLDFLF